MTHKYIELASAMTDKIFESAFAKSGELLIDWQFGNINLVGDQVRALITISRLGNVNYDVKLDDATINSLPSSMQALIKANDNILTVSVDAQCYIPVPMLMTIERADGRDVLVFSDSKVDVQNMIRKTAFSILIKRAYVKLTPVDGLQDYEHMLHENLETSLKEFIKPLIRLNRLRGESAVIHDVSIDPYDKQVLSTIADLILVLKTRLSTLTKSFIIYKEMEITNNDALHTGDSITLSEVFENIRGATDLVMADAQFIKLRSRTINNVTLLRLVEKLVSINIRTLALDAAQIYNLLERFAQLKKLDNYREVNDQSHLALDHMFDYASSLYAPVESMSKNIRMLTLE